MGYIQMSKTAFLAFGVILLLLCNFSQGKSLQNSTENILSDIRLAEIGNLKKQSLKFNCSNYLVEKEYVILENGSLLLPKYDSIYAFETYFLQNGAAFLCVEGTTRPDAVANRVYDFSQEFLSCGHVLIDPEEYELLKNGSIYIAEISRIYGPRDYYIKEMGAYICAPNIQEITLNATNNATLLGNENTLSESYTYITYVCLSLSIISLFSHLAVFCAVPSVRNLAGWCLASLSLSLLMAYLCVLALESVEKTHHCANLGMAVYYFFLASFFWMNTISFNVWRSVRMAMQELEIPSQKVSWRRFLLYSLYSWLVPAALTAFVKVADSTDLLHVDYKPSFGAPECWFGQSNPLLVFFITPLFVIMLMNAIFFFKVTRLLNRAALKSQSREATLKRFFMFMRLALIMGLTWIVGLIAGYVNHPFMWYLFVILNTLQGFFIFVVFSINSNMRGLCCKTCRKTRGNTSVRTSSEVSAAV